MALESERFVFGRRVSSIELGRVTGVASAYASLRRKPRVEVSSVIGNPSSRDFEKLRTVAEEQQAWRDLAVSTDHDDVAV